MNIQNRRSRSREKLNTTGVIFAMIFLLGGGALFSASCDRSPDDHLHGSSGGARTGDSDSAAHGSGGHGDSHGAARLELTSSDATFKAGTLSTWTLKIVDAQSGRPIERFQIEHEKLLHLIIVSRDLAWFNHLHPEYRGNGEFEVTTTLPRAGRYRLYADFAADGSSKQVIQHDLSTAGAVESGVPSFAPDPLDRDGWAVVTAGAAPEGEPDKAGPEDYRVALMPMNLVAGKEAMLHFQVRDRTGTPLTDLEPYLGAMGHVVVLSADAGTYLHGHPAGHGGDSHAKGGTHDHAGATNSDPNILFHTNFPKPGLYKLWGQFKHRGKIVTAPFVVEVSG